MIPSIPTNRRARRLKPGLSSDPSSRATCECHHATCPRHHAVDYAIESSRHRAAQEAAR